MGDGFLVSEKLKAAYEQSALRGLLGFEAVEVLSDGRLRFSTFAVRTTIERLSRGDMTGDGLADLTVRLISSFIGGTGGGTSLFVVSRDGPREVLYVVEEDAGNHVCQNY